MPVIICHDQEPLNFPESQFDFNLDRLVQLVRHRCLNQDPEFTQELVEDYLAQYSNLHLLPNFYPTWLNVLELNDWTILLHSEVNSRDVDHFAAVRFYPVYYWCHAVISRDWYRFAQHDVRLINRTPTKTFLIYCRDWLPTREYRLKFLDLVVKNDLTKDSCISTQHVNSQGVHLTDYKIQNYQWSIDAAAIAASIPENNSLPSSSADYDAGDITSTRVSVVLETVFDGDKIHLTEKILRPIACAHPFVLAAGPGSLEYLRSYGFRTFGEFWDESYDQESDMSLRLEKIVATMKQIQNLTDDDWQKIQCIAESNQRHFFSHEFMNQVSSELTHNLNKAVDFCVENRGENYWTWRKILRRMGLVKRLKYLKSDQNQRTIKELRRHRLFGSSNSA